MKRWLSLLSAALCFLCPPAQAAMAHYELVKEKSAVKFYAIVNGAPLEGRFKDFSAQINLDPEKPEESSLRAEVEVASVEVGNEDVAKNIVLPEWLSAAAFPKATLVMKKLSRFPETMNYYGDGELTLRGIAKPVSVSFQIERMDDAGAVAKGYFTLQRKDYQLGGDQWKNDDVIKNEVRVDFRVYAKKI